LIETKEYDIIGNVHKLIIEEKKELKIEKENYTKNILKDLININPITNIPYDYDYSNQEISDNLNDKKENKKLVSLCFTEKIQSEGGLNKEIFSLSLEEQLKNISYEYETYKIQIQKFKDINNNIVNKKEIFFPDESKELFIEYIEVITYLLEELSLREFNIIASIPLPEQTGEEINFLTLEDNQKEVFSENIPLPEQTEEEINSLLEPEDFMFDAIYGLDMFSEEDKHD
jgi:hypothetical protein